MLRALKHTLGVCLRLLFIGERARLRENPQISAQPEQSISNVVFYTCIHIDIHTGIQQCSILFYTYIHIISRALAM